MGSVAKRRCARGAACYQVRVLQLEEPPKLRATRQSDICEKCEEDLAGGEELPQEHKELFRAARVLIGNNFNAPQDIIPTVVFAVVSAGHRHLEELKESLAANDLMSERGHVLRQRFAQAFDFHSISALIDGVPIISQNLIHTVGTY